MVNVRPPKKPIKQRTDVVVVSDNRLLDVGTLDHCADTALRSLGIVFIYISEKGCCASNEVQPTEYNEMPNGANYAEVSHRLKSVLGVEFQLSDLTHRTGMHCNIRNLRQIQIASKALVAILAICLPAGIWAVMNLPVGSADVHEWLPEGRPERTRYEAFTKAFGSDQVVLISWDGCRVEDPRLAEYQVRLREAPGFSDRIASLASTDQLMQQLTAPPLSLTESQVAKRFRGVMLGEDGTAAIVAHVTTLGVLHQNATIEMIQNAADQTQGLSRNELRLAGTVVEAFAVDASAEASLKKLVLPSSILGVFVAWACLKHLRRTIVVFVLAGLGQLLAVAMVYYTGNKFSAVLIVLPTLIFMLTLSGAVHLMNYYSECSLREADYVGARAMLLGWKPCALSGITTMLGMGSLWASQLAPIRQFGLYSAVGLGIATVVLLLGFPVFADWFCRSKVERRNGFAPKRSPGNGSSKGLPGSGRLEHKLRYGYLHWLNRNATWVSAVGILVLVAAGAGLTQLKASTKFSDMFPTESKTNRDMAWIEQHVGPIATVEVLLYFPADSASHSLDRAEWVSKVSEKLLTVPEVGGVLSAVTFLPTWSNASTARATAKRALLRRSIDEVMPNLERQGLVSRASHGDTWRVLAKVSATSDQDYGQLTRIVASATQSVIQAAPAEDKITAEFTGLSPVMHETQLALLTDLGYSFLSAFALITPMMMFIVRGVRGGLLIMLPNVLPVTIAFGCMGWCGFDLDIAGILTASIALGIAVDDTLHFTCWYMDELRSGCSREEAVARTFGGCSNSMIHTTLISCFSMAPFLLAEFIPTQQFAKLMIAMLTGAIVGDLLLLPALLLSPLGKVIHASRSSSDERIAISAEAT